MLKWMCHDKSEWNAKSLTKSVSSDFTWPHGRKDGGLVVQDATLMRDTLRNPIQPCFNPLHPKEIPCDDTGGSPQ